MKRKCSVPRRKTVVRQKPSPSSHKPSTSSPSNHVPEQQTSVSRFIVWLLMGAEMALIVVGELTHDTWLIHTVVSNLAASLREIITSYCSQGKRISQGRRKRIS